MTGVKVVYRGVMFEVKKAASANGGHTIVKPTAIVGDQLLGYLLARQDVSGVVGKAFKVSADENSDEFGVKLAVNRCYRGLVGLAKVRLSKMHDMTVAALCDMQKRSRLDQERAHNEQYPKAAKARKVVKGAKLPARKLPGRRKARAA